jgi:putative ABC transport system permease protein
MAAVWLIVRAGLRTRWRSWLLLAVLAGLVGGLVMAVAAGARRTDAAYPSLVAWSAAPDALIAAGEDRVPQVSEVAPLMSYSVLVPADLGLWAPADSRIPELFWHRKLLAGRLPDPGRPDEADVSFTVAQAEHVAVGDRLCTRLLGASREPVPFCFRIVGVDAAPGEFPPQYGYGSNIVWATPAFTRAVGTRLTVALVDAVRLRRGAADLPAVEKEARRPATGTVLVAYPFGPQAANTEHSIHLQVIALWLLAGVLAVVGLLIFGQLMSRLTAIESADFGIVRALGMTSTQLTVAGLARAAMIGGVGAVLAAFGAAAASPLFPVGLAGVAEPAPGFRIDWVALVLGMAGIAAAVLACAAWPAVRAASRPRTQATFRARRPPALGALVRPVTAATGTRLVLHRGAGRTALPVRASIVAAAVGVGGLSAALVFAASLGHLLATPALYGVTWDAMVAYPQSGGSLQPALPAVTSDTLVAHWAGEYGDVPLVVDGVQVGGITTGPGPDGSLAAVAVDGTPPLRDDEIVLGRRTLAAIGRDIGQTVRVSLTGTRVRVVMRIVGTAVFPPIDDTLVLGTGAELTVGGLHRLAPPGFTLPPFDGVLVSFRSGASVPQALDQLAARVDRAGPFVVTAPSTPGDLVNFGQLQDLPLVLGLSLGALALLTIAHLLFTSVRRRRRDLMVLRAIGFTGGQVRATVCWMSVTLMALGLAAGVPVGLFFGRLAWRFFAVQLGIAPVVVAPVIPFAILVVAGLALAVAVTAGPAVAASRSCPASVLRAELRRVPD